MVEERAAPSVMRRIFRSRWQCRKCREYIGGENIAVYSTRMPDRTRPTWFFAAMTLLDHLRDCSGHDYCDELRQRYGQDFLRHPEIYHWFNQHGMIDTQLIEEYAVDEEATKG
jgi:hypothetical protein